MARISKQRNELNAGRRTFVKSATALMIASSAECSYAQAPARGGTLRISVSQRINTLNPLRHSNTSDYMTGELMYSGLCRLGRKMEALPDLATEWRSNAALTEWTFKLRPRAMFRGVNREVKPRDVVASFRAIKDPASGSPARASLDLVSDVVESGPFEVRVILKDAYSDLPVALAHNNARIVPADIVEKDLKLLETGDYGTGPFKLAQYEPGRLLRVERDARYFKGDKPYLDAVEQRLYPDLAAEYAALANGESDILLGLAETDYARAVANKALNVQRVRSGRFFNLVMRCDQKPFNDLRVRKAMQMAVDRESLLELVLQGFGKVGADNPISAEYPFARDIKPAKYDPAQAKRLLAEAGYPNGLKITLFCANRPAARSALGVAIKEMARSAGFDIDVQTIAYDVYNATIWRKANFYVANWNMQPTPDAMFALLFTTDAPWNDTRWNNPKFDDLVRRARATVDAAERARLYGEAQGLLNSEVPYLIPFFQDLLSASAKNVMNYHVHPRGGQYFLEEVWLAGK
ncbi:MAG: ABC transporter substrate-binding protein [Ramlibacter sp.]|nr:ABC transporter substrate-binding protein [Ramlibacter sp.]